MKTHTSILSGGKTRELFSQLNKANPTKVANAVDFYAEPQHQIEGTLANFDRYVAGDR